MVSALLNAPVAASGFDFMAPPQSDLNRLYRLNTSNGEITACQYFQKEGTLGVTLCFPAGEGAGKQEAGDYRLVASRHEREGGIFRVEAKTGAVSICFVYQERVVCTPSDRPN
jgi:hypothetical protein